MTGAVDYAPLPTVVVGAASGLSYVTQYLREQLGEEAFFSICGRMLVHGLFPPRILGSTRSRYSSRWRSMKPAMNGQNGITNSPRARASSSAARASRPPRPRPS